MPQRYGRIANAKKIEKINNLKVIRFYTPQHYNKFYMQFIGYIFFSIKVLIYGFKYRSKFDCVFATSSRLGTSFLGLLLSRFFSKKFFLDIRDVFSDNLNSLGISNKWYGHVLIKFLMKIETLITRNAHWINFVSPGFSNYNHIKIKNKNYNLFTNGIDEIFIKNRNNRSYRKGVTFNHKLKIIYAGNIGFGQGLEKTIIPTALRLGDKVFFQIIGDGSSKDKIVKAIKRHSILNIEIISPVNRIKLLDYYNAADVMLLQLNKIKAFNRVLPSKVFDYGSFDKPIIAGVTGVAKNFLKSNVKNVFFYDPGDYKSMINVIKEVVDLDYIYSNNTFVKRFNRSQIMDDMVRSFLSIS